MCNNCDCENYDLCSIVGSIPVGFCCPKCNFYNEDKTCKRLKVVKLSIPDKIETPVFGKTFCMKQGHHNTKTDIDLYEPAESD